MSQLIAPQQGEETRAVVEPLPLLPPSSLSSEQKELYDEIMRVVKERFGSFVATRQDAALIGPFNAVLHFPAFAGSPGT